MRSTAGRPERRALLRQQLDAYIQSRLLLDRQVAPPVQELVGDLDLPHFDSMS